MYIPFRPLEQSPFKCPFQLSKRTGGRNGQGETADDEFRFRSTEPIKECVTEEKWEENPFSKRNAVRFAGELRLRLF